MKNTGLSVLENSSVDTFTTDVGLKIREKINPLWRKLTTLFTNRKVILEQYPELNENEAYIFVCEHSFDEDVISLIDTIDRNAYVLNGSTDQTEHSPKFIALWANGMVYVNRKNNASRSQAIDKMERVINSGNSTIIFGSGGYNNSENRLIPPLFHSPYILQQRTNAKIVPVVPFNEFGTDKIYISAVEPIDVRHYGKYEAAEIIREKMATLYYDILLEHTETLSRKQLLKYMVDVVSKELKKHNEDIKDKKIPNDPRDYYMEMRRLVYNYQDWYNDVWDEELTSYPGHDITLPEKAREYIDNIEITKDNAYVLAPVLVKRKEDIHYDLKRYLRENIQLHK